jgi:hypothetical protein
MAVEFASDEPAPNETDAVLPLEDIGLSLPTALPWCRGRNTIGDNL